MQISSKVQNTLTQSSLYRTERKQNSAVSHPQSDVGLHDSVAFSQDALLLAEATKTAQKAPDVRQEKVNALRVQVQNGTYQVDSSLIAKNLLRDEQSLFVQ